MDVLILKLERNCAGNRLDSDEVMVMARPVAKRRFENDALRVPIAMSFGFDAFQTNGLFFTALDPPLPTGQTAGFCSSSRFGLSPQRGLNI